MESGMCKIFPLSKKKSVLLVFLILVGVLLMQTYFYGLRRFGTEIYPTDLFWFWGILILFAFMCLWNGNHTNLVIVSLFILSMGYMFIPTSRFDFLPGSDLPREYYVAQETQSLANWPPELPSFATASAFSYAHCLSVTILPTMISAVTGFDILHVFQFVFPLLSSFLPVLYFLVVREVYNSRLAGLSSVVFLLNPVSGGVFEHSRQNIATFTLFLSIFCILKKKRKYTFLALVFASATSLFHYTTAEFAILISLILLFSPKILGMLKARKVKKYLGRFLPSTRHQPRTRMVTITLVLFIIVVTVSWFTIVARNTILLQHVRGVSNVLDMLMGVSPPVQHYKATISYAMVSEDYYHTIVRDFIKVLVFAGFFVALKNAKDVKTFSFTILGGTMFVLLLLWMIIPGISQVFFITRIYAFGFVIFSTFVVLSIDRISSKAGQRKFLITSMLLAIILLEGFYMNPIYMHTEESLNIFDSIKTFHRGKTELEFGGFIKRYVNKSGHIISDLVRMDMIFLSEIHVVGSLADLLNATDIEMTSEEMAARGIRYVIVTHWLIKEGYVITVDMATRKRIVLMVGSEKATTLLSLYGSVYSNGDDFLLHYPY